jgi:pilus assembly protein CpaB
MSRFRLLLMAFVALALSAVLTLYIYREVSARLAPAIDVEGSFQIVVAAERLPLGVLLEVQHLKTAPWSRGIPLEGSFNQVEEVVGRGVVVPLLANEPVLESKLAPREAGAGVTTAIPTGMRAVSVRVNEVIGVAGFVLPGTRVDVIVTGSPEGRTESEISKIVLENVEVLAAGQNVERDSRGTPQTVTVVTLLVAPEDAQLLALASVDAQIQLALRNPMDLEHTDPDPTRKSALYARSSFQEPAPPQPAAPRPRVVRPAPPPPPPPPPEPKKFEVELIQGSQRQTHTFEEALPEQPAPQSPSQP